MALPQSARRYDPAPAAFAPIEPAPVPVTHEAVFQFVVRCFVERKADQWQAFSLEFGLAAQADSEADAKRKLESMIHSYIEDIVAGEDREHAYELLSRRAPWSIFARYYLMDVKEMVSRSLGGFKGSTTYNEYLPLIPKHC